MAKRTCPNGHVVKDGKATHCPQCGAELPEEPRKKRGLFVKILIGVGALLILCVILAIAFSGGDDEDTKQAEAPTATATATVKPEPTERPSRTPRPTRTPDPTAIAVETEIFLDKQTFEAQRQTEDAQEASTRSAQRTEQAARNLALSQTEEASRPTPEPELPIEIQLYALNVAQYVGNIGEAMTAISGLMGEPKIGDETWTLQVAAQLAVISVTHDTLSDMDVPAEMADVHESLLDATGDLQEAAHLTAEGIDELDLEKLNQAAELITQGNQKTNRTTELMTQRTEELKGGVSTQGGSSPVPTSQTAPIGERVMYFCGFDRCKGSGSYGELIFETGINVWNNPDPDRGGVHHQANHQDRATVIGEKRVSEGSGGLWYQLEGGGWTNDLWLTEEPCTENNLAEYTLDDC